MCAEALLARLERVRKRAPSQWSARCPAHDDKGPSLSIKELPDGTVLLKCFAGCEVEDVVRAVGLDVTDLFPPRDHAAGPVKRRRLLPPSQALEILAFEALVVATAAANMARGMQLTAEDLERLHTSANRIHTIAAEALS